MEASLSESVTHIHSHLCLSCQNVEVGDFGGWEVVSQRAKEVVKVTSGCVDFMKQVSV